jgi:hypothetical protein
MKIKRDKAAEGADAVFSVCRKKKQGRKGKKNRNEKTVFYGNSSALAALSGMAEKRNRSAERFPYGHDFLRLSGNPADYGGNSPGKTGSRRKGIRFRNGIADAGNKNQYG